MPYIHKFIAHAKGKKAYEILLRNGYNMREAQRLIDKGRLICGGEVVSEKNALLSGEIYLIEYETNPRGLKPIFECDKFVVFDKPSGVLSHPNGRHCEYSLNDEIWSLYGREASVAHRLDCETSGLIVVGKDKNAVVNLKKLFENRQVYKSYVALVHGKISENLRIEANMDLANDYDDVKMRMRICEDGKSAVTEILPIEYFADIEHKIVGKPLYGLARPRIEKILDKEMSESERILRTGAPRLLLHSDEISFKFDGVEYKIKSKFDAKEEFYKLVKHG